MKRFVQGCLMMLSETRKIQELGYDKCHFRLDCIVSWRLILGKSCQGYALQFCYVGDNHLGALLQMTTCFIHLTAVVANTEFSLYVPEVDVDSFLLLNFSLFACFY
ncbi:Uncharacterized protein HZ326_27642 [Fusarium oxysporum f. sp. albedinis]|nr:Uncharacterized protein HZ326_27642 [Fusarium oxysporum f. sp. albedinis]